MVTVGASYIDLSIGPTVALALAIAAVKATLVAMYFMHLKGEVKAVFQTLMLTGFFFVVLMIIPIAHRADDRGHPDPVLGAHAAADHGTEDHGEAH